MNFLILLSLLLTNNLHFATAQENQCPDDLSPCTCGYDFYERIVVSCYGEPMEDVKSTFSTISPIEIYEFYLYFQLSGDFIPSDLLGENRVVNLNLGGLIGPDGNLSLAGTVDPNAFRNSNNTLSYLQVLSMDTSLLDFGFLKGFQKLNLTYFSSILNLDQSLPTLPFLPALSQIKFFYIADLNKVFEAGSFFLEGNGITELLVNQCGLDENGLGQMLDWILPSSAQTLQKLDVTGMIGSIPRQMISFSRLENIRIYSSVNLTITSNSFLIPDDVRGAFIDLTSSYVVLVESGAFLGNYSYAKVRLYNNLLTRFEEGAFKLMLQDMESTGQGGLNVDFNPFDCYSDPCHLAWLLVDNRDLFKPLSRAGCSDGTQLYNLNVSMFSNCKETENGSHQLSNFQSSYTFMLTAVIFIFSHFDSIFF